MIKNAKIVGLVSFSDHRERVHKDLSTVIKQQEQEVLKVLKSFSDIKVVTALSPVHSIKEARREAERMKKENIEGLIFHFPVFGFPHYSTVLANIVGVPVLVFAPRTEKYPALTGLLNCGTNLVQIGIKHVRVWDDIEKVSTKRKFLAFIRSASAIRQLKGQVFGLIGGRSMGLYGTTADVNTWQRMFGVDIEHIDELEIVRRAVEVSSKRVDKNFQFLKENVKSINFDQVQLTEEKLKQQIRHFLAVKEIIKEYDLDFLGIKCHYEMSENFVTQCLSTSFLNDPYDLDDRTRKTPIVTSCEADSNGALTMQVMKLLSNKSAALMDIRHYDEKQDVYVFSNCGAAPTCFSNHSDNMAENFKKVALYPAIQKYRGGGCHVLVTFKPGDYTVSRLMHTDEKGDYSFFVTQGNVVDEKKYTSLRSNDSWTHAFIKMPVSPERFVNTVNSNHLHLVAGDYTLEIEMFCKFTGVNLIL